MKNLKKIIYTVIAGGIFLVIFSLITALFPNNWFIRMTPANSLDYVFLVLTSLLLGAYVSLSLTEKKRTKQSNASAYGGGVSGFLGFGCALCNKLLLLIFGAVGVLIYIEPYRPLIGAMGVGLMSYAVYIKLGQEKKKEDKSKHTKKVNKKHEAKKVFL